jgi:hypothetical protein
MPTPTFREVEREEDEATDDPPIADSHATRWSLSPAAKRQQELEQKVMEEDLHRMREAQRASAGAQAKMHVKIGVQPLRPKLRAPATVR